MRPAVLALLALLAAARAVAAPLPDCRETPTFSILVFAGFAAAATWQVDEDEAFADRLRRGSLADVIDFGNTWGDGRVIGGLSAGALALGAAAGDDGLRALGADMVRSFALSSALTLAIKGTIDRTRPSGGPYSFPSGHTSAAFSIVPALHRHAGWRASGPAAALGVITALGRLQDRHHYLSDVIFGGALGWVAGDLATRVLRCDAGSGNVFLGPGAAGYAASF